MLCYLHFPGRILQQGEQPPAALCAFVAEQLGPDAAHFGDSTAQAALLFLGKRCCDIVLPLPFKWQPNIATVHAVTRRWREHFLLHVLVIV
jgi:hypothetical protein